MAKRGGGWLVRRARLLDDAALALGLLLEGDVLHLRGLAPRHRPSGHVHVAGRRGLGGVLVGAAVGAVLVRRARHGRLEKKRNKTRLVI